MKQMRWGSWLRNWRTPLTRGERADRARRQRAMAHLERVRAQHPAPSQPSQPSKGRRHRDWRPAPSAAAISLAAGLLFGIGLVKASWPGRLDAIHVRGTVRLSSDQVAAATGVEPGAELASVDAGAVVERLQTHDWIHEARALRLPVRLLVQVRERVAVAVAPAGAPPAPFFVDASGMPFAPVEDDAAEGLPRLLPATAVAAREPSDALARAAALAARLPELGLPRAAEVSIAAEGDPEGFALRLSERAARVVLGRDALERKLGALARLLAEPPPELAQAASLDLRFADQVVLREGPTPKGAAQAAATRGRAAPSTARPSG